MIVSSVGITNVVISNNGGHSPEKLAEMALDKIIHVGRKSHPLIIDQALAFKDAIREVLIDHLQKMEEQTIDTLCVKLSANGYNDIATLLRRI